VVKTLHRVGTGLPRKTAIAVAAYIGLYLVWQVGRWGGPSAQPVIGDVAYWPINAAGCWLAWRASREAPSARVGTAWRLLGLGMVAYLTGDVVQFVYEVGLHPKPYPSWADVAYLSFFPLVLAGMLCFPVARGGGRRRATMLIDCATVAIGGGAIVWYVVLGPTAVALGASRLQAFFSIAYPVGDLIVIVGLAGVLLRRTLPSSELALRIFGVGALFYVTADVVYGYVMLHGSYMGGDRVDTLWMVAQGIWVIAAQAQRHAARAVAGIEEVLPETRERASWMPYVALIVLFGLLAFAERRQPLVPGGILVIGAILATGLVAARQFLAQRELVIVHAQLSRAHGALAALATTDPLTGLANHRAMVDSLDRELERARRYRRDCALLFVDLDHFKALNDSLGHGAGDRVLGEVGELLTRELRAIDVVGRWGGEEFVVLLPELERDAALGVAERLRVAIADYLFAGAGGAHLTCSIGVAGFPADGITRDELLHRADRAMYAAKSLGRNQALAADHPAIATLGDGSVSRDDEALMGAVDALAMLVEIRDDYTGAHAHDVALLSREVAVELGCPAEEAATIALAARLHDVGKVGVPDSILRKPGRLTPDEWAIMRRHTITGAEVVSRIPRLRSITPIVRGHHERYDGTGYPDGLAGTQIPLGARIIATADAYDAMTTTRPYRDAMTPDAALDELRLGTGHQFDPAVIAALTAVLTRSVQHAA
jgi:two-component system cell cycle response regulator